MHIEVLLEEPSAEAFLAGLLPRLLPPEVTWNAHVFQGKPDLLGKLEARLRGYRPWIPADWRLIVLVDSDHSPCKPLKAQLEDTARRAGFSSKSNPHPDGQFVVLNRIAVEELEAWFFGSPATLAALYPGVPASLGNKAKFRNPDAITGGTWEALERVLQKAGHFRGGLSKVDLARNVGTFLDPAQNSSQSFATFVAGVHALCNQPLAVP